MGTLLSKFVCAFEAIVSLAMTLARVAIAFFLSSVHVGLVSCQSDPCFLRNPEGKATTALM